MSILPENADPKVRRYFEYYNRRLQGESIEGIAEALGFWRPGNPYWLATDLYGDLKRDGFPVCEVCGETPAPARHCRDRTKTERLTSIEMELRDFARRSMESLRDADFCDPVESREGRRPDLRLRDGRRASFSLHPWGEERYYRAPQISAQPPKTDGAIIAALAIMESEPLMEGKPLDSKRVPIVLSVRKAMEAIADGEAADFEEVAQHDPVLRVAKKGDMARVFDLELPLALLREYRPDFDAIPEEDRVALLQRLCGHVSALIRAADRLQDFLERGTPGGIPTRRVKDLERCILAAELKDALGCTYREVGEVLRIPLDQEYYALKGTNKKAEAMVARGRELLMQIFGVEECYESHMAAVKPALGQAYSLTTGSVDVEEKMRNMMELTDDHPEFMFLLLGPEGWLEEEENNEPLLSSPVA